MTIKSTLLLLFLATSILNCNAQSVDSTAIKLDQLKKGVIYMRENLRKSQSEFNSGLLVFAFGVATTTVAVATSDQGNKNASLITVGSIISTIGVFIILDSRKFIGRAGRWKFSPTGVGIDF